MWLNYFLTTKLHNSQEEITNFEYVLTTILHRLFKCPINKWLTCLHVAPWVVVLNRGETSKYFSYLLCTSLYNIVICVYDFRTGYV